jgi:hypothetical protein
MTASRRRFLGVSASLALLTVVGPAISKPINSSPLLLEKGSRSDWYLIASQSLSASPWVEQFKTGMGYSRDTRLAVSPIATAWQEEPHLISDILLGLKGKRTVLLLDARDEVVLHIGLRDRGAAVLWEGAYGPEQNQEPLHLLARLTGILGSDTSPYSSAQLVSTAPVQLDQPITCLVVQL